MSTGLGCAPWPAGKTCVGSRSRCPRPTSSGRASSRPGGCEDKGFVWERPLRKADLRALGAAAPTGPILGARVEHLVAKEALLADDPEVFFTTPHFDGYPAVLVRLDVIGVEDLDELIVEAWLARAPKRLAQQYIDSRLDGHRPPCGRWSVIA